MLEKEMIMNKNNVCLTNSVSENSSCLFPRERERVRIARKASQALVTHSASDIKSAIRMNLTRDNKATTEDASLAEKTFGTDIGGLKGKTTISKPLTIQSQVIDVPRGLSSLHEEV